MIVSFHSQTPFLLKEKKRLKNFIKEIFRQENQAVKNISVTFCSDSFLLDINRQFLKHDYFTDIITFNLAYDMQPIIGDIYISTERVLENAKALGISSQKEMLRVIFHGVLHLCGYKDKTTMQIDEMRQKENYYLDSYIG